MGKRKKELLHAHHLNKGDLSTNSLGGRGTNLESSTLRSADDDLLGGLLLAGRDGSLLRGLGRGGDVGSADVDRLDLRGVLDVRLRLRDCGHTSVVGCVSYWYGRVKTEAGRRSLVSPAMRTR